MWRALDADVIYTTKGEYLKKKGYKGRGHATIITMRRCHVLVSAASSPTLALALTRPCAVACLARPRGRRRSLAVVAPCRCCCIARPPPGSAVRGAHRKAASNCACCACCRRICGSCPCPTRASGPTRCPRSPSSPPSSRRQASPRRQGRPVRLCSSPPARPRPAGWRGTGSSDAVTPRAQFWLLLSMCATDEWHGCRASPGAASNAFRSSRAACTSKLQNPVLATKRAAAPPAQSQCVHVHPLPRSYQAVRPPPG